jgi:hypothetical protein
MELPLEIKQDLPSKGQLPSYNGGDRAERRSSSHIPSSEPETTMNLKQPGQDPQDHLRRDKLAQGSLGDGVIAAEMVKIMSVEGR